MVMKTPIEKGTLEPTWPDGPKGNLTISADSHLRIELWTADPVVDKPVIIRELGVPPEERLLDKLIRVEEDTGARIILAFEPAHAIAGLGLWYELRERACAITRLLSDSPASRAGLARGDEVIRDRHQRGQVHVAPGSGERVRRRAAAWPPDRGQARRRNGPRGDCQGGADFRALHRAWKHRLKPRPAPRLVHPRRRDVHPSVKVPPFGLTTDEIRAELAFLRSDFSVAICRAKNPFNIGAIIRVAHSFLVREIS